MAIEPPPATTTGIHPLLRGGALVRLGGWAGAAILAVALLALTAQTEIGNERLQGVVAMMSPQIAVAKVELPPEADAKRLETLVVALTDDRERLHTRIASLERKLEDTTGSIKQQQANLAAKVAAAAVPAAIPPAPPPPPAPVMPILAPLATPPAAVPTGSWPEPAPTLPPAETVEAAPAPVPPERVALAPVEEPVREPARKPEIGIDLGGAANLDVLNARWVAVKANFGPQLAGLYPRAIASKRPGASEYRLLAGPLPNNTAASQICAHFITARITCRTVRFDGERLVQR
jgi:hypothetical protein